MLTGKECASLARCVGRGVGGVGVGMGHASLASYGGGRLDESWEGTRIASTLCRQGRWRGWCWHGACIASKLWRRSAEKGWEGTRIASTLCRQGRWRGWCWHGACIASKLWRRSAE